MCVSLLCLHNMMKMFKCFENVQEEDDEEEDNHEEEDVEEEDVDKYDERDKKKMKIRNTLLHFCRFLFFKRRFL